MMLHLYTDASYDVDNEISGWGCALVKGEVQSFASGYSKNIPDIIHAEAHAIRMGIINFMMEFAYPQDLIIWCDNMNVCSMMMRQARSYGKFDQMRSSILDLLHSNGIPYHFNYTPRMFNDHAIKADNLARKQLNSYD